MAETKGTSRKAAEKAREEGKEVPISQAADGGESRLHKGYKDNPDKPDETSIAQVQELHDEEPSS